MAKKKLSRDQKRKKILQKRSHGAPANARQNVAEKLLHDTERIINETFISFGRQMYDSDVLQAVNQLVVDVQKGNVSKADASAESANAKGALVWNIKQRWAETHALDAMPRLVSAQALQSLAQRVDGIRAPGESQSYLRFVQGTQQTAILAAPQGQTEGAAAESTMLPAGDWSDDEARLLKLGLAWLRGSNEETWKPFAAEGERMNAEGQVYAVASVCQYLYGLTQADPVEAALRPLLNAAHEKMSDDETEAAETPVSSDPVGAVPQT
jgi:hypothetical protein